MKTKRIVAITSVTISAIIMAGAGFLGYRSIKAFESQTLNVVNILHKQAVRNIAINYQAYHLIGQVQSIRAGTTYGWQSRSFNQVMADPDHLIHTFRDAPTPSVDYLVSDSGTTVFSAHYPFVDADVCMWSVRTLWYSGLDSITVGGAPMPLQSDVPPEVAARACGVSGTIVSVTFAGTVSDKG